ncbi:MAG: putative metallo-hydrolase YycJ [Planctomycetes bacterium ADurb.Bin401]|nr:MAG: putative metallo-hydrolase YycJ [Planctomycetes bacterium ADurb.Bin401]
MPLYFQSLRSSSSGNCLLVRTDKTAVLIDCGLGSMRQTREILSQINPHNIDLVLVSHLHSDHISYYPMRVIEERGTRLKVHKDCFDELKNRHFRSYGLENLKVETYDTQKFTVKDLVIEPFEIPHNPYFLTCGFVIYYENKKIVIATDFRDARNLTGYFTDANFIFIEANHDLQLLKQFPNPNSHYHLPNPRTASFLCDVIAKSKRNPAAVMLGHLSNERNTPQLAIREIKTAFKQNGIEDSLKVTAAPPYQSSEIIEL